MRPRRIERCIVVSGFVLASLERDCGTGYGILPKHD